MNFTEKGKADLDSPRQELSIGGFGIVVTLTIFPAIDFVCVFLLAVKSSVGSEHQLCQ